MALCLHMNGFLILVFLLHSSTLSASDEISPVFNLKVFHQFFMRCIALQDLNSPPESDTNLNAGRCLMILDRNLTRYEMFAWDATQNFLVADNQSLGLFAEKVLSDYILLRMFWIAVMKESPVMGNAEVFRKRTEELHQSAEDYLELVTLLNDTSSLMDYVALYKECPKTFDLIVDQDFYFPNTWGLVYSVEALRNLNITKAHSLEEFLQYPTVKKYFSFDNYTDDGTVSIGLERHRWGYDRMISFLRVDAEFRIYVNPPVFSVIIVFGLLWNVTLLFIFARHEEVRTAPNIMVFNMALVDLCNILIAPLSYLDTYPVSWSELGRFTTMARSCFMTLSGMSLVALSAQRYWAVYTSFKRLGHRTQFSQAVTFIYVLAVWISAILFRVILPLRLLPKQRKWCDDSDISPLLLYVYNPLVVFVPPLLVLVFGVLTAQLLRRSVRDMPGTIRNQNRELARYRSARILTSLAVAFAITYFPYSLWSFLVALRVVNLVEKKYLALNYTMYYLFFANSCLNPVALYIASHAFRVPFNKYLFCVSFCKKNVTRASQKSSDSNIPMTKTSLEST